MSLRLTEEQYEQLRAKLNGLPLSASPTKPSKYRSQKTTINGITFDSKWEAQAWVDLDWQYRAGLISKPLVQVPFSLGQHYGKERKWIADFAYVHLETETLIVADAKGFDTPVYKQKKKTFEKLYGIRIEEIRQKK